MRNSCDDGTILMECVLDFIDEYRNLYVKYSYAELIHAHTQSTDKTELSR